LKYVYICGTIAFTVYGQLILKWRLGFHGSLPESMIAKLLFLLNLFGDIYILSGFAAAFISSLFWMAAMTSLELSVAYPIITGGLVVLTTALAVYMFGENITLVKITGVFLILLGVFLVNGANHAS